MIRAATRIFAGRGYSETSMDEIAHACGVTKPMLYAYFSSKEGLLVACLERGEQALEEAVSRAALRAGTPEKRLWSGLVAVFEFFDDNPDLFEIAYGRGSISPSLADATARGRASMAIVAPVRACASGSDSR
ncbi:MAG: hypothetical protein QOD53_1770, partial [Thermoleophilaceae bacterium]|nr:hypothetical protein [Thermoleophilaceae bacterium]